jgi:hypothetical protein
MSVNSKMEAHAASLKAGTRKAVHEATTSPLVENLVRLGYGLRCDRRTGLSADTRAAAIQISVGQLWRATTRSIVAPPDRFRSADRDATGASGARSRTARSEAGAVDRSGCTGNAAADRNRGCTATFRSTAFGRDDRLTWRMAISD